MDIPHSLKITTDGLLIDSILDGKLMQRLLAFYIVSNNVGFVTTMTTEKLLPEALAFIQLFSASYTVPDNIGRPAEKAFF